MGTLRKADMDWEPQPVEAGWDYRFDKELSFVVSRQHEYQATSAYDRGSLVTDIE
jgi:hypothetical protein